MAEPAFLELRRRLIQGGISPWRVGRVLQELRDHHAALVLEQERAESPQPVEDALARLGTEESLARQFLARRELQSWSRRWPWAVYIVAPLFLFPAAFIATILAMVGLMRLVMPGMEGIFPTPLREVLEAIRLFGLYVLPVIAASGFALLARRRGVSRAWACASTTLITFVGALPNLDVYAHQIGAGIGFSTRLDFLVEMSLQRWLPTAVAAAMLYMAAGYGAHRMRTDS
jgi:hypothetical protein